MSAIIMMFNFRICCFTGLLTFLLSCQSLKYTTQRTVEKLNIHSLKAVNLSENSNAFSTHNDEIFLAVYQLNIQNEQSSIESKKKWGPLVFTTQSAEVLLENALDISKSQDSSFILFALIELDNEQWNAHLDRVLESEIEAQSFFKRGQERRIDSLMQHDDFLGWKYIDPNDVNKNNEQVLIFKGIQLFDRYEYHLKLLAH